MSSRKRQGWADKQLDKILAELPLNAEHREFVERWNNGPQLEEIDANEILPFVFEYVRLSQGRTEPDPEIDQQVKEALASARLDWRLAFAEGLLRRIAADPVAAIKYLEARDTTISKQKSENASKERAGRHDWWGQHIGDCLEGNFDATVDDVIAYLLETEEVRWSGDILEHIQNKADPITRAQVRSRMAAAKKRILRES